MVYSLSLELILNCFSFSSPDWIYHVMCVSVLWLIQWIILFYFVNVRGEWCVLITFLGKQTTGFVIQNYINPDVCISVHISVVIILVIDTIVNEQHRNTLKIRIFEKGEVLFMLKWILQNFSFWWVLSNLKVFSQVTHHSFTFILNHFYLGEFGRDSFIAMYILDNAGLHSCHRHGKCKKSFSCLEWIF